MILSALNDYYERLLACGAEGVSPLGYSQERISYEIVLASDGRVLDVNDICDVSGKKPVPRILSVPQPPKKSSNISPSFLWGNTSYVLGVSAISKRSCNEHDKFVNFHRNLLSGETDIGIRAFFSFLESWNSECFAKPPFIESVLDTNVVFRLDGERGYLHERLLIALTPKT